MSTHPGYVFDAAFLGIVTPPNSPLLQVAPGEIVLRIPPEGLSLRALRARPIGQQLMYQQNWYDECPWGRFARFAGVHRLRIPVPESNQKSASEQDAMLVAGGEISAPVALVAAALLGIRRQGGSDPLNGGWVRCAESTPEGGRVALTWCDGRLAAIIFSNGCRGLHLSAASVRTYR